MPTQSRGHATQSRRGRHLIPEIRTGTLSGRSSQLQWRRAAKHRKIDALECDAVTIRQLTSPDRLPVIFLTVLSGRVPTRVVRK
jgi:hypothetical protein